MGRTSIARSLREGEGSRAYEYVARDQHRGGGTGWCSITNGAGLATVRFPSRRHSPTHTARQPLLALLAGGMA